MWSTEKDMYINLNNRKNIEMDEDTNYSAKGRRTVLICYGHNTLKLSHSLTAVASPFVL